jgi:hypothetical protein
MKQQLYLATLLSLAVICLAQNYQLNADVTFSITENSQVAHSGSVKLSAQGPPITTGGDYTGKATFTIDNQAAQDFSGQFSILSDKITYYSADAMQVAIYSTVRSIIDSDQVLKPVVNDGENQELFQGLIARFAAFPVNVTVTYAELQQVASFLQLDIKFVSASEITIQTPTYKNVSAFVRIVYTQEPITSATTGAPGDNISGDNNARASGATTITLSGVALAAALSAFL